MSLVQLWKSARAELLEKHVQQIISFAGSGRLSDGTNASKEFREFLAAIPSEFLERYASDCLAEKFDDRGFALQDIVNQIGSRLGFSVKHGRYRGTHGQIGYDGLWFFPADRRAIIVEVKTTDAYTFDLDTLAEYRRSVLEDDSIKQNSASILIVIGSEDTRNLEAQIRGSRYAWDIRLISVSGLLRLLRVKEETEDPTLFERIQEILVPREFTKVDEIIDLVFSATQDLREEERAAETVEESPAEGERKPKFVPVQFNDQCIEKVQLKLGLTLVKVSRSKYISTDQIVTVVCAVSREHEASGRAAYWYAFHPHQKEALSKTKKALLAFGCGSPDQILLIPFREFEQWLEGMNITNLQDRFYWHVSIFRDADSLVLHRKKGFERIDITKFLLN